MAEAIFHAVFVIGTLALAGKLMHWLIEAFGLWVMLPVISLIVGVSFYVDYRRSRS